ncbi:GTP-binding protein EngB [hydrothermal vent metagenome]|uniref:GTP-binding protein EngB n=1 Tax=hydrothermal vent metagenome TaxID=652676 RepID=A0A3B1A134_9ZZZZ
MNKPYNYNKAEFLNGIARLSQLPEDVGYEVAFAGRSNVGKSSALNAITNRRALARTSKTPGRTQQINLFTLDVERRLADLPGYGFAKVPNSVKKQWYALLETYLQTRASLRGIIVFMDVRRPFMEFDVRMLDWCTESGVPTYIVLTKSDKLKRGPALAMVNTVKKRVIEEYGVITPRNGGLPEAIKVQLFSSLKKEGVAEVHAQLDYWLSIQNIK